MKKMLLILAVLALGVAGVIMAGSGAPEGGSHQHCCSGGNHQHGGCVICFGTDPVAY